MDELKDYIKKDMDFIFVDNYFDVLEAIFGKNLKFKKPWTIYENIKV